VVVVVVVVVDWKEEDPKAGEFDRYRAEVIQLSPPLLSTYPTRSSSLSLSLSIVALLVVWLLLSWLVGCPWWLLGCALLLVAHLVFASVVLPLCAADTL
jgi:hypothetical protein